MWLEQIKNWLLGNGYPEEVIADTKIVDKFRNNIVSFGLPKCPVNVGLPWIGSLSQLIADKVSSSVPLCFNVIMVRTIFITQAAFRSTHVLLIFQQSNLIHKFQCCWNATYIGRISRRLEVIVKQYVPRDISNHTTSGHSKLLDSAICEHLNAINNCMVNSNDECFGFLHKS